MPLTDFPANICLTVASILIHQDKVLLVKHKKLGIWLNPGGHIEENELPHQTAEREFWEETGVKVEAFDLKPITSDDDSQYLPNPIASNLHWVSQKNFDQRQAGSDKKEGQWQRGCEQHIALIYLVRPVNGVEYHQNVEETDGIAWFTQPEVAALDETVANVKTEIDLAFSLVNGTIAG
jgi:ADP-ribose pyrophosphatase YjhB (NUDIX family)